MAKRKKRKSKSVPAAVDSFVGEPSINLKKVKGGFVLDSYDTTGSHTQIATSKKELHELVDKFVGG